MVSLSTARRVVVFQAVAADVSSPRGVCVFVLSSCFRAPSESHPLPRYFGFLLHGFLGVSSRCVPTLSGSYFAGLSVLHFCSFSTSLHSLWVSSLSFSLSLSPTTLSFFLRCVFLQSYLPLLRLSFLPPLLRPLIVLLLQFLWVLCSSSLLRGFFFFGSGSVCECSCIIAFL